MPQPKDDLSRSLVALEQDKTLIAVVELSSATWLVGGMVPGIKREPLKKLAPDQEALLALLHRWRDEAIAAGHAITRLVVAFEAGRDGFWLARWLRSRGVEAYVIHPTSIPVSRERRRAKTDRLDIGLLKRSLLGWLRGEKKHGSMAAIPHTGRGGCETPDPRARATGWQAHRHRQPDESRLGASRHSRLQPEIAQSTGAACNAAHAGGMPHSTQHTGRAYTRDGASAFH